MIFRKDGPQGAILHPSRLVTGRMGIFGQGRIAPTIKGEEVDLSEHEHYTAAAFQPGLILAEIGLPNAKVREQFIGQARELMAYSEP